MVQWNRRTSCRNSLIIPLWDKNLGLIIIIPVHLSKSHTRVVLSESVNTFKSRLDKFWQHQDMIYDFQAELHGTGSRSLHHN